MIPKMTIDLLISHKDGIIFILLKGDIPSCKGMRHLPGGTILLGERLSKVAVRIYREEVGLTIKPLGIIGVKRVQ